MGDFVEVEASNFSLGARKLIYGVGVNDAWYAVYSKCEGHQKSCPFYSVWCGVLRRCYSDAFHIKSPTYKDCTICDEWLVFSNFRSWMERQDWQGKEIDKDLLVQCNQVYSPETCMMIDCKINTLLNKQERSRGMHPRGVYFNKESGKYRSQIRFNGKRIHIGYYDNPDDAFKSYALAKYEIIKAVAISQKEPLKSALLNYVIS